MLLLLWARASAGCDCSYPRAPAGAWANGSVLDLRQSVAEADFDEGLLARLHSNQTTHTEGGRERPMYAPPITTQVAFWFAPSRISPLPCAGSRGEDSVVLRTFFFDALHRPLLSADATFVEIGANDGMLESTTLFFERCLGWSGALIEPHPRTYARLLDAPRRATKIHAAVCAERGNVTMSFHDGTAAEVVAKGVRGLAAPCAPLGELLAEVPSIRRAGRVDFLSLDVQGAEPIAARTLGAELSYGVVMAEAEAGPRRIGTVLPLLARGFRYAGQIAARPSPANYVTSDVFYNESHFQRFWPHAAFRRHGVQALGARAAHLRPGRPP